MVQPRQDITQVTLAVLFIGGLLVSSAWIMLPFLPATIWALTLVIATWPLMIWVERRADNRRGVAVLVMIIVLLLVLIVPSWLAITMIVDNVDAIIGLIQSALRFRLPPAPEWLDRVPLVGVRVSEAWSRLAAASVHDLAPTLDPYAGAAAQWFISAAGNLGGMFLHFLLTTAIAAVMYARGEQGAAMAIRFGRRLAGDRGEMVVHLAGQAVRGVALGVVVTAVAQSALGGIGLLVVGMPFASVLTAVMFIFMPDPDWSWAGVSPAVIWMYYSGDAIWASILLVFTIVAGAMDGFLRPYLIRKGAGLPLLLIFEGVIGDLVAFGMLGIFVGPTLLATAYTLLQAWMADTDNEKSSSANISRGP